MKLSWTRHSGGRNADAALPSGHDATQAEVERLLTIVRTIGAGRSTQAPAGLEQRVIAAVKAQSGWAESAVGWRKMQSVCSRGWVPATVAAALFCVFTGGIFVARETSLAAPIQREALTVSLVPAHRAAVPGATPERVGPDLTLEVKSLAAASAHTKPASPVSTGQRRGRASTVAAPDSR